MTKAILDRLKAEYEATEISIDDLVAKYSIDLAELKGYKAWTKNLLNPQTRFEKKKHLNTHIDIVAECDDIVENEHMNQKPDTRPEALVTDMVDMALTDKVKTDLIVKASVDIQEGIIPQLPKVLKDGFEGLRRLDTSMQTQAQRLVDKIDDFIDKLEVGDTKGLKELINSHTDIRNTYFNQKNTMVNIINGDVTNTNNIQNNLASFIAGVEDDC